MTRRGVLLWVAVGAVLAVARMRQGSPWAPWADALAGLTPADLQPGDPLVGREHGNPPAGPEEPPPGESAALDFAVRADGRRGLFTLETRH